MSILVLWKVMEIVRGVTALVMTLVEAIVLVAVQTVNLSQRVT